MALQCPHCQSAIAFEGKPPREVVCPSCGSSIQLDPGGTAGWLPEEAPKRLGRFVFLEQLGVGSFGTVYKARDTELDRLVAVKVPRAGNLPQADDLDRFLREARSAAQLKHPGIVALYDAGPIDGTCCLVSEFIQGATLAERLSAKRFSFRQAAELLAEVAEALHYAHQHGVIHRDIKPSNILLDLEGRPHLMDFGLAKRAADAVTMTLEGQVLGTPAYMSPEQARGEARRVDARSDVYSLGVVLYELLTGELPFRGQTRMLLVQVLQDEPRRPRGLNDRIPRDLETICLKAMAKEPARRYATARDFADDLRCFLKGEPIQARPLSTWERGWRWAKRRPAVAGLLLVSGLATLMLVGGAVGLWYHGQLQEEYGKTQGAKEQAEKALEQARQAQKQAERYKYILHIARASAGWREGNVGKRVDQLLDELPPEQRRWEWHYLKRLCHADLLSLTGHEGLVYSVAYRPDGKWLASASHDGCVKVSDATTGKELRTLTGHTNAVYGVAFSPNGTRLASAGADDLVMVWDATTGTRIHSLPGHTDLVWCVAFSPDGTQLASGSEDRTVKVWDQTSGKEIRTLMGHRGLVSAVAFSPDGKWLASVSSDWDVKVWDVTTGTELHTLKGHTNLGSVVAFSPDGTRLASAGHDQTLKVWDATSGQEIHTLRGHTNVVRWLAYSPDGSRLASASWDGSMKVWDTAAGQEVRTLKGHALGIRGVAFSPDGSRLATAGIDQTVKVWDATTGQEARTLTGHASNVALGGGGVASQTARIPFTYLGGVTSVAFLRDGTRIASAGADGTVKLWDATTGQEVCTLAGHTGPVWGVAFSPKEQWLASAGEDRTGKVWDVKTGRTIATLTGHTGAVYGVAISPDGTRIASAGADGTVKLWDASTGQELRTLTGHRSAVYGLAFSPDGTRLTSAGRDGTVKLWDATTGQEPLTLRGHNSWVSVVAFSPDGTQIASAGHEGTVKLWDATTGQEVRSLKGHTSSVYGVAFSPDGTRIASASLDQTVKVWDSATGEDFLTLRGHNGLVSVVAFSADGTWLASAGRDGAVKLWDARPWTPEATVEREALGLLAFLFAKPLRKADVQDYLRNSQTIRPEAQQLALSLLDRYREEENPERYHQASWAVARQRYLNSVQYRFALQQAEAACQLAPQQGPYRTSLGAAQYRAGAYANALKTLTEVVAHNQGHPVDLAFLAMTQNALGQKEQARATLARLREAMQKPEWAQDEEASIFLREAEAVVKAKVGDPEK